TISGRTCVRTAGICPTIGVWIVSAAVLTRLATQSTPHNHFTTGPYCGVRRPPIRPAGGGGRNPTVCTRIVSAAGIEVNKGAAVDSAPDNHFTASPDRCVTKTAIRRVDGASRCPTVRARIISPAGVEIIAAIGSAPDYHLTA